MPIIRRPEEVTGWRAEGAGVAVTTTTQTYRADKLVLAAGPWAAELLADRGLPLQVVRIVNMYFAPTRPDWWTAEQGAPDFSLSVAEGGFYGMPSIEGLGVKIGRHDNGEPTTARTIRRTVDAGEIDVPARRPRPLHARRERPGDPPDHLHVHDDARTSSTSSSHTRISPGRLRLRLLRHQLQILRRDRRDAGRPRLRGETDYDMDWISSKRFAPVAAD